jgi:hypothetical protein
MIKLHYDNQTNKILGAYADNDNAPEPNITVDDDAWVEYDTVENGELVHNGISLSDAKIVRIAVMKVAYNSDIGAGVTTNSILMDADEEHISRFKVGYDLAILESEATMDIIDFNNTTQADIAVADALTMIRALGVNARTKRFQLQARRTSINAAANVNDVNAITW